MKRKLVKVNNGHDMAGTVEIEHPSAESFGRPVREKAKRVMTQTVLDRWLVRGGIDERQFQAGDRLRGTIERAGLMPRVTRDLRAVRGNLPDSSVLLPTGELQAAARAELRRALGILPRRLAGLVYAVCADQETPSAHLARHGMKGREAEAIARERLLLGLDLLADFWGV